MNLLHQLKSRSRLLTGSMQQGVALVIAANVAYALDYFFNFAAGRLLDPAEFSIVVALAGVGNVLVVGSRVIQTVVTRYVARFQPLPDGAARTASFFRRVFRSAWRWGTAVFLLMLLLSVPLARFLQVEELGPVLALAVATLLLVVRPVVGGTLQGQQQFAHLGVVQIVQALARLLLGGLLMWIGWGAFGALAALPVASLLALGYGLLVLSPTVRQPATTHHGVTVPEMFRYSAYTAVGLLGYALLANMDAILVRRFFEPDVAGNYGAAITLGKIIQFLPVAIITILFPKAAQRRAAHRDPAAVLIPAMLIVALLCAGIAGAYALFTDFVVQITVGAAYQVDSLVLGLLGGALGLLALANVWLNYFLSTERPQYVYLIGAGIVIQFTLMLLFHDALWQLPAAMAANGLWLTLAGGVIFWQTRLKDRSNA